MTRQAMIELRGILVEELEYVAERIRHEPDPSKRMFLFSATFGMVDRVMRLRYDRELLLAHTVLNPVYGSFVSRLNALAHGDAVVPLTQHHFNRLAEMTEELAKEINGCAPLHATLEKFNEPAFLTTGAGHYMRMKEQI